MTIERLIQRLVQTNSAVAQSSGVVFDIDIESGHQPVACADTLFEALTNILLHAIKSSPAGSRVAICSVPTANGTDIEIADSSEHWTDSTQIRSYAIAKSERTLRGMGGQFCILNCPQGGVAYSISVPHPARAAA